MTARTNRKRVLKTITPLYPCRRTINPSSLNAKSGEAIIKRTTGPSEGTLEADPITPAGNGE